MMIIYNKNNIHLAIFSPACGAIDYNSVCAKSDKDKGQALIYYYYTVAVMCMQYAQRSYVCE